MIRVLTIIAVAGFVLCVVCLSGAAALGGRDLATKGWKFGSWDVNVDEASGDVSIKPAQGRQGSITIDGDGDHGVYVGLWEGPTETRDFPWSGAGEIDVGMPADVTYTQGPAPKITVTGPKGALDQFHVDGEDLRLRGWNSSNTFVGIPTDADTASGDRPPRLKIDIVAPGVTRFDLSGSETLTIDNYNQDSLDLDFSGASKVTAKGSARLLTLDLSGAASADLSGLALQEAEVELSGASRATIAPKAAADFDISGASHVTLLTRPERIVRDVSGAAVIEEAAAPATKTAAQTKAK